MTDVAKAKETLLLGEYTCVLRKGERSYASTLRGVKPLVVWLREGIDCKGFSAADKVVGRATAFLYALLGVKNLYAGVLSQAALAVLQKEGIAVEYGTLVPHIINRTGDGVCPFEGAVLSIEDKQEAYAAICQKMRRLGIE